MQEQVGSVEEEPAEQVDCERYKAEKMHAGRWSARGRVLVAAIARAAVHAVLAGGLAVTLEVGKVGHIAESAKVTRRQGALLPDVPSVAG